MLIVVEIVLAGSACVYFPPHRARASHLEADAGSKLRIRFSSAEGTKRIYTIAIAWEMVQLRKLLSGQAYSISILNVRE
jgi:hypothetical protein